MILPVLFQDKVKFLCDKINKVEWSGILFYDIIKAEDLFKPKDIVLKAKDIYLMDKGTSGSTSYEFTDFMDCFDKQPELERKKIGHIHSHNSMNAYFSPVDDQELHNNVAAHNQYLSLIVNNDLKAVASWVFLVDQEYNQSFPKPNGKRGTVIGKQQIMIRIDLDIKYEIQKVELPDFFQDRVDKVIKDAKPVVNKYNWQTDYGFSNYRSDVMCSNTRQRSLPINNKNLNPTIYNYLIDVINQGSIKETQTLFEALESLEKKCSNNKQRKQEAKLVGNASIFLLSEFFDEVDEKGINIIINRIKELLGPNTSYDFPVIKYVKKEIINNLKEEIK